MQSHHAPDVAIEPSLREEQQDRAQSRAARWTHGIRGFLDKKVRLANRIREELGEMMEERRRKRVAEKVRKYKPLELCARKRPTQEKSRLVSLPAEIRIMIWEYAMTGQFIVLYRKRGKVTSSVFDSHGTTSVANATVSIMTSIAMSKAESGAISLPLTCTTTYLETMTMLYQENTFVFLDTTVLVELCRERSRFNMTLIRSLHYFVGTRKFSWYGTSLPELDMIPSPTHTERLESASEVFHECLPNLQQLSIFLYGPIRNAKDYTNMLEHLHNVYRDRISINMNALGVSEDYLFRHRSMRASIHVQGLSRLTSFSRIPLLKDTKRPHYYTGPSRWPKVDDTLVENSTWRAEMLHLGSYDQAEGSKALVHVVLRPEDESRRMVGQFEPAILWDLIPDS